ncbi:hypothetical protein AX14_000582 [Amanita brunnescens Koide BX004]|nr:hypothetical protein AX14_000582 [Amanita brunnescens Koide BX004]
MSPSAEDLGALMELGGAPEPQEGSPSYTRPSSPTPEIEDCRPPNGLRDKAHLTGPGCALRRPTVPSAEPSGSRRHLRQVPHAAWPVLRASTSSSHSTDTRSPSLTGHYLVDCSLLWLPLRLLVHLPPDDSPMTGATCSP